MSSEHEGGVSARHEQSSLYHHRMTYPATVFNDLENIEGTDVQSRCHWHGFLADIFISRIFYVHAIFDSLPVPFSLSLFLSHFHDTDVRVKPTPAALPNATGVVIDFDRKICCCYSPNAKRKYRATTNSFSPLEELNFDGEHERRVYVYLLTSLSRLLAATWVSGHARFEQTEQG